MLTKNFLYKFLDNYLSSNAMFLVFLIRIQASNDKPRKTCFGCISKPKSKFKNRKTLRSCLLDRSAYMANRFGKFFFRYREKCTRRNFETSYFFAPQECLRCLSILFIILKCSQENFEHSCTSRLFSFDG